MVSNIQLERVKMPEFESLNVAPLTNWSLCDKLEPLQVFLYYRFGFNFKPSACDENSQTCDQDTWIQTRKKLGDDISPVDGHYKAAIIDFVEALIRGESPSSMMWDLCAANPCPLRDTHPQPLVKVIVQQLNTGTFYSIEPVDLSQREPWILMTPWAAAALECLRRGLSGTKEIAHYFLDKGIPFTTRVVRPQDATSPPSCPLPPRPLLKIGLGLRPPKYTPDATDYDVYCTVRDKILRRPWGRAARMQGGILWRLSMECLAKCTVTFGPTERAFTYKSGDVLKAPDGSEFWDDFLTEDEIEQICGVYKVSTGVGVQSADMSWWPKPSAWRKSGLNVGYWSPFCEGWFQDRVNKIKSNTAKLRSGTEWSHALRLLHKQAKLAKQNERLAAQYLQLAV